MKKRPAKPIIRINIFYVGLIQLIVLGSILGFSYAQQSTPTKTNSFVFVKSELAVEEGSNNQICTMNGCQLIP